MSKRAEEQRKNNDLYANGEIDREDTRELETHSRMLGRIAAHVSGFAEDSEDTTLVCVLRLLRDYHYAKAEIADHWLEKEGKE